MTLTIRSIQPDELEEFRRVSGTALIQVINVDGFRPEWTLCAYENNHLATSFGFWPFTMCLNGKDAPFSAITMVGTLPAYRRRGHLRKIMTTHFENLYQSGERVMAVLWASRAAIYQRYGYGIVTMVHNYSLEPRYIQFSLPYQFTGKIREAGTDDFAILVDIYRKFRLGRIGSLHRGKMYWDINIFGNIPQGSSLNKVIYEEQGQPLGYMIYITSPPASGGFSGSRLMIRDLSWLTYGAYRALWEHLGNMDLIQEITWQAPPTDPLPHLILEPRMLKTTTTDGLLARLVDVKKGLTQRGYQNEGALTFELVDDICPWNTGKWQLETSGDSSQVKRTMRAAQVKLPLSTLSMLFFNQITATEAMRMGRLIAANTDVLKDWDRIMWTQYKPGCVDHF